MEFDDDAQKIAFEKFMMRYKSEYRDFSEIGEGTYSNSLTSIAFDCYVEGAQSRQAEIDELQKRIDEALKEMEAESANSWGLWKEKADMYEQGASNAYEKSYWILKGKTNEQ